VRRCSCARAAGGSACGRRSRLPLVEAALTPATFDPRTAARTLRLGLSDAAEMWLLPPLVKALAAAAPALRVVAVPVQFRSVAAALAGGLDAAVTVADELPAGVRRQALYRGGFTCLFDPRHVRVRRLTEAAYFAHEHVVVSYNGDLRGVVEHAGQGAHGALRGRELDDGALIEAPRSCTVPALVAA
jgi:LysR family transcriptional activator of mexEF-oprN operon